MALCAESAHRGGMSTPAALNSTEESHVPLCADVAHQGCIAIPAALNHSNASMPEGGKKPSVLHDKAQARRSDV